MIVVGMTGRAGSGKDTIADELVALYGFQKLSCAGPLKAALAAMGFPEPADRADKERPVPGYPFTWREAAQKLGTEFGRGLDADIWVKMLAKQMVEINRKRQGGARFVISDVRFDNEADVVRGLGGTVLHLYGRAAELGANATHASEDGVEFVPGDWKIDNSRSLSTTMEVVRRILKGCL